MSKFRVECKEAVLKRAADALRKDIALIVDKSVLGQTEGHSEAYLASLGLSRSDLKRMERARLALRGYLPTKSGHQLRWILLNPGTV